MEKLTKLLFVLVLLAPFSSAVSVGASPGFIDIGEVEPGTTQEIDFYITTNSEESFQVSPSYQFSSMYAVGENSPISMQNVSEQDISTWIDFTQDTYTIDPTNEQAYELPDGSTVNAEGRVTMEVSIPPNAEPGYRTGEVNLQTSIAGSGGGAGARVLAQTVPGFAFRVPGSVSRDIDMDNLQAIRVGENRVQVIAQLRNKGTVTTKFRGGSAEIRNSDGSRVGSISFGEATLEPGEYAEVDTTWISNNIGGEYSVEGTGDYRTGETYISGNFVVTDTIQERKSVDEPSGGEAEEQESGAPIVMIVILSLLLATLLYLIDVSFTWIIMLAGSTAVALYILLGPVSNTLVLIPLVSMAIMMYI